MPSINKFRVSNVKFMNDKRFYDDLVICANEGKFLFEGENGDGKTLYMQCVAQSVKPNSYFRKENKIKRLFEENSNTVIHSMMEWSLDEGSEYDYLITGFCAKATKNEEDSSEDSFKYFNYAIMYNADTPFSVESIPLKKDQGDGKISRMNWSDLRSFIKRLNENEDRCVAKIFDINKEYSRFLENYNIDGTEWDLILRINFEEGGSETYLANSYPTAKSFIQEELIPIIESIDRKLQGNDYSGTDGLVETLINIKKGINKYSEKRSKISELTTLEGYFNEIVNLNEKLEEMLNEQDKMFIEVIKGYNKHNEIIDSVENEIEILEDTRSQKEESSKLISSSISENKEVIKEAEDYRETLNNELEDIRRKEDILRNRREKQNILVCIEGYEEIIREKTEVLLKLESKKEDLESKIEKVEYDILEKEMENVYIEYIEADLKVKEAEKSISLSTKSNEEIFNQEKEAQSKLLYLLNSVKRRIDNEINKIDVECASVSKEIDKHTNKANEHLVSIGGNELRLKELDKEILIINNNIERSKNEIKDIELSKDTVFEKAKNTMFSIDKLSEKESILSNIDEYNNLLDDTKEIFKKSDIKEDVNINIKSLNSRVNEYDDALTIYRSNAKASRITIEESLEANKKESENKIKEIQVKVNDNNSEIKSCEVEINNIKNIIISTNTTINNSMNELDRYYDCIAEIDELLEKHNKQDRFEVEDILDNEVSGMRSNIFNLEKEINDLSDNIESMKKNQGVNVPRESKLCYEILSKAYNSAVLGVDFINSLNNEEKYKYLDKTTAIQGGVLLSGNEYSNLRSNKNLRDKISDFSIPIFNIDKLKEVSTLDESVFFLCSKDKEFFLNEDKLKMEIEQLEKKLQKLIKEKETLVDLYDEKNEALKLLIGVNKSYGPTFLEEVNESISIAKKEISDLEKELDEEKQKINDFKEVGLSYSANIDDINKRLEEAYEKSKEDVRKINANLDKADELSTYLNKVRVLLETVTSYMDKYNSLNISLEKLYNSIKMYSNDIVSKKNEIKLISDSIELLKVELDKENSRIEDLKYTKKDLEDKNIKNRTEKDGILRQINDRDVIPFGTKEIECNLSIEEVRNELKVLGKKIEDINSTIQIYKENLESFKEICNDKLLRIERSQVPLEDLESRRDYLRKNTYEDISILEGRRNALKERMKLEKSKIKEEELLKNSVESQRKVELDRANKINTYDDVLIEEGYDPIKRREDVNSRIDEVKVKLQNLRNLDDEYIQQLNALTIEISSINSQISNEKLKLGELNTEKTKIDILINTYDIDKGVTTEVADNTDFVINKASYALRRLSNAVAENKDKQCSVKERGLDDLARSAFEIVSVLREIKTPTSVDEIYIQRDAIKGFIEGVLRMKEGLEGELTSFQELKDNFVTTCINKTDSLISKLHDLSNFSTVFIEKKKIPLLKLQLNELKEEDKREKMTKHIFSLIDKMDEVDDKEALIAEELSSRVLLEQCVNNMKNCEVRVYVPGKVDITDGYYEKWGGGASGGQRNTIYLTVVIALIIFIRELGTIEKKSKDTKVLYADGPFKGSQSVYLWECIFALMKENNIQFIATNNKTPAALLNLFDSIALTVGYEKIIGGKSVVENRLSVESIFKTDERSLRGENILNNFGEYRIPKKVAQKNDEYNMSNGATLFDLV